MTSGGEVAFGSKGACSSEGHDAHTRLASLEGAHSVKLVAPHRIDATLLCSTACDIRWVVAIGGSPLLAHPLSVHPHEIQGAAKHCPATHEAIDACALGTPRGSRPRLFGGGPSARAANLPHARLDGQPCGTMRHDEAR